MATKTKQRNTRTMYMHTLDGKPARVVRMAGGKSWMVNVTPGVRIKPLASLGDIRTEVNEVADYAFLESKRSAPSAPRQVHGEVASGLINRLGYVLVEVPSNA